jgi:hypothetical protein
LSHKPHEEIIEVRKNICAGVKCLCETHKGPVTADMLSAYLTQYHKVPYTLYVLGRNLNHLAKVGAVEKVRLPGTKHWSWQFLTENYEDPLIIQRLVCMPKALYEEVQKLAKLRKMSATGLMSEWLMWCAANLDKVGK